MVMFLTGEDIRELRNALGMSLEAFGKKLGVSAGAVCYWESNARRPRYPMMERLNQMAASIKAKNSRRKTAVI